MTMTKAQVAARDARFAKILAAAAKQPWGERPWMRDMLRWMKAEWTKDAKSYGDPMSLARFAWFNNKHGLNEDAPEGREFYAFVAGLRVASEVV